MNSDPFRPGRRDPESRLKQWARRWGADLMLLAGAGCVSAGVWWICPPAGLIAAGVLLMTGGVLCARGGEP